jgi:hypothetical protein
MREFKFRFWDKSEKRWSEGVFDHLQIGSVFEFNENVKEGYEIQQYTGIKDKNGKEIYEGDILSYRDEPQQLTVVRWTEESMDNHPGWVITDWWTQGGPCEIVGNIFENPELLK